MRRPTRYSRMVLFIRDMLEYTPILRMIMLLLTLWFVFAAALYVVESQSGSGAIRSYLEAVYWCVAAFSTAGIADKPESVLGLFIGGLWIIVGSVVFFGSIVATVTTYFMRPLHRPARRLIDTIEYNLEQLDELSIEELDLLKETVDALIENVERLKERPA